MSVYCTASNPNGLKNKANAKNHWDKKMQYDLVWDSLKTKIEKYIPFIRYDKDKIKNIVLDYFDE